VLGSALAPTTPAFDLGQACATGLEAVVSLNNKINAGQIESGIASGVDSASDAPIVINDSMREILLELTRAKTMVQKAKIASQIRPAYLAPQAPSTAEPRTGLSMGEHQAITTAEWGITRRAQDELAVASHRTSPLHGIRASSTISPRPTSGSAATRTCVADSSMESLAKLGPVFGKKLAAEATMTAGNSTPLTDGASSVLLGSEDWAAEHNFTPLARLVDAEAAAVDFVDGAEGLLMAPAYAVPRLLARNGLTFDDFDVFEIHEAFASTVLSHLAAWESEEFCTREGRTRQGSGRDRPRQAQPAGFEPRRRSPLRRHRRTNHRHHRQIPQDHRKEEVAGLDLRRRRPGTHRDCGGSMKDTYLSLVNGPLKQVAKTLGLPQPVELNRFGSTPASYTNKPVLVLGSGPGAQNLADLLLENGLEVRRNAQTGEKLRAIIAVLDDAQSPADLSPIVLEVGAALRSLTTCGRVITISTAPDPQNQTPEQAATTQGITGFTRSVAHEMRAGATANGILLDGVDLTAPSVAAALWFLLSGKSAYVSGQFLTVSSDRR
jgi:acetyl-CoA acetyltransferase family protein